MAKLKGDLQFTGSLGELSAYKRHDMDTIIVRRKGGASKQRIKKGKEFVNTRRNMSEFAGRSVTVSYIRRILWRQKLLADYNFTPVLQGLLKVVQEEDRVSDWGQRNIYFTKNPQPLEGFSLNRRNVFDSIVRSPVSCTVSKSEGSVVLVIPSLLPGINFMVPGRYPAYSFVLTLGVLPDFIYNPNGYAPSIKARELPPPVQHETGWLSCQQAAPAQAVELKLNRLPATAPFILMVALGIRFGTLGPGNEIEQVKRSGAAKILCMAG